MARRSKKKKAQHSQIPAKVLANEAETNGVSPPMPPGFSRDWLWGLILVLGVILA